MASQKSEGRVFTFVDYDINRRGVTDTARAHLMKDRVRTKREARSEWVSRNQFSPLRWMRPKQENHQPESDTPNAKPSSSDESDDVTTPRISHYAAVIDFQRDSIVVSPFVRKGRSQSPRPRKARKTNPLKVSELHDNSSESSSSDRKQGRTPEEESRIDITRLNNSLFLDAESPISNESIFDIEQIGAKHRRTSRDSRSEFGLSLLEGLRIESTPPPSHSTGHDQYSGLDQESQRMTLQLLLKSIERSSVALTSVDHSLLRYFAMNAVSMLGLDIYPEIVEKHDPIFRLFLPFAISNQWCLETMVLLFSANHCRRYGPTAEVGLSDTDNHYLASRQNFILARTRERISALAHHQDSSDENVVAFLFLALSEYCVGSRQIGLMHFKAWKEYCEMRRTLGISPCGLPCKTIVWWCISILCEDDVALDGIINPTTRIKVQDDPGKLLRYFETMKEASPSDVTPSVRPDPVDRRTTC